MGLAIPILPGDDLALARTFYVGGVGARRRGYDFPALGLDETLIACMMEHTGSPP